VTRRRCRSGATFGLVALATGVGLYWLGEADAVEPGALRWAPRLGAGQVGVVTEGSW